MTLYGIALYVVPIALAVIAVWIGFEGLKFYWAEVVVGRDDTEDSR